ncbi:hypothetical protein FACS189415_4560 [Bacteroidia bacterium]|nr:hypothetical protein FACS189415_4560 [Bacteroidia bacterium]
MPLFHLLKEWTFEQYSEVYQCRVFVEIGTFMGDMVYAEQRRFKQIYSIELDEALHEKAVKRFKGKSHIHILQGDSGKVLKDIVPRLKEKAIFWLDGHYSGGITAKADKECPIIEELDAILKSDYQHVILIDDAICFNGTHDYPTIPDLTANVHRLNPQYKVQVYNDIIRLTVEKEAL